MKAFVIAALATIIAAGTAAAAASTEMKIVPGPDGVQWGPAPPALPPGAQAAIMSGDPAQTGFVSMRAKLPAGYTVPPHWHPTDEHVTVISGTMQFGMGDKIDTGTMTTVNTGGYFVAPASMHHYARTPDGAVVQIDLVGPFGITYVNAADDPRNKTRSEAVTRP